MGQRVIQRCVFPLERHLQPLYYWMDRPRDSWLLEPEPPDRFSIRIERGWKLITDAYFNSFFECYWRRYTRLGRLRLRLDLAGTGDGPAGAPLARLGPLHPGLPWNSTATGRSSWRSRSHGCITASWVPCTSESSRAPTPSGSGRPNGAPRTSSRSR